MTSRFSVLNKGLELPSVEMEEVVARRDLGRRSEKLL